MIDTSQFAKTGAWKLTDEGDGIWSLTFDLPGEKVNKLTAAVLEDLDWILEASTRESDIRALIVIGGKESSGTFIAGADIEEIRAVTDPREGTEKAGRGQAILGRLADIPAVTIAAIHGNCLGGGTELALACDLRVASDSSRTKIGLPEVQLGILPGFGGTQRLPRLVGLTRALPVILSGRPLDAKKAAKLGLVDRVVYQDLLLETAKTLARDALAGGGKRFKPRRPREPAFLRGLSRTPFGRWFIRRQARKDIERRVGRHYPAPFKALEAAVDGFPRPLRDGLKLEASLVGELIASPVSKNLISLFLSSEEARRGTRPAKADSPARPAMKGCRVPDRTVGVLGAGVMGGGIAALLSRKGFRVRLKDIQPQALQLGLAKVHETFSARVKRRRMTRREMQNSMAVITTTLEYTGFGNIDSVIEAVVEDMNVKQAVLRDVEGKIPADALFASNTSALSISELQSVAQHPERVVGLHFFNPVERMMLVEIIAGEQSSDSALAQAEAFARDLGKIPVRVKDGPGFLVNRLLAPYLNGAIRLFQEGYDPVTIDEAVREFGMPMGPFELIDEVGLDVAGKVAVFLHGALGERLRPPEIMDKLLETKLLGKKVGKGFYVHQGKKKHPNPAALSLGGAGGSDFKAEDKPLWIARLVSPIVNEAALALEDKIVAKPSLVDLAMVMGTGFAPFRGGPLRYADSVGAGKILEGIEKYGVPGEPAELLSKLAKDGSAFYSLERSPDDESLEGQQGSVVEAH